MAKTFLRRGRFEIISEILSLCRTPTQKTHILYKCNLSFEQLKKYLDFLVSNDLLTLFSEDGKELYQITENGRRFLEGYEHLKRQLDKGTLPQSSKRAFMR